MKQAPKTWYDRIDSFLTSLGFTKSKANSNLYYKVEEGNPVILLLYVNDLFVTGVNGLIADTKRKLAAKLEIKDLGNMHYFLGMEVWQNADGISLGQGMMACKAMTTPMASNMKLLSDASSETIGSLMYLMNTRPDICFVVKHLEPVPDGSKTFSLDYCKAYSEVPKGYS